MEAVSNKSNDLLNDIPGSSPSPQAGCVIFVSVHHETTHTSIFHRKGCLMLHHLADATIQVANLVNYNYHPPCCKLSQL